MLISVCSFGQWSEHSYTYGGLEREFNIYVPSTYNSSKDTLPLVFFLHGMGGSMSNFSGLDYKAESAKYIMVVPQAISDPKSGTTWHSGAGVNSGGEVYYPNANVDDVGFISSLIDTVSKWYRVNPDRVFSTGFSMGGFMSNRLGCELSNKISAIASVAGTIGNEIIGSCNPENIVPALHIHSTNDATVAYTNNTFGNDAETLINFWVANNNCNQNPDSTVLTHIEDDNYSVIKYLYKNGSLGSEVEFYKLIGPDHNASWYTVQSGNDFDAVEVIWNFFNRHATKKTNDTVTPTAVSSIKNVKLDAYPNPATDIITLSFSGNVPVSSIVISNTLGKTLETKYYDKPIKKSVFDISNRAAGIYFFQIKDIEGNLSVLRFYKK